MKKANTTTKTMTLERVQKRKLTRVEREALKRLAAMPDDEIDLSDIPDLGNRTDWVRNPLYRPVTQPITIRLNAPDVAMARQLSKVKGMPYQTYIKKLLHEALGREHRSTKPARESGRGRKAG
jgi:predicted DNA binding CopG/RHH family protein